jgi:pantoate--beta-alanine ligase
VQIIRAIGGLADALEAMRGGGDTLALVPTMGALHAGHLALVTEAKRRANRVVATIFVNPLQFGAGEDLGRYPRQEAKDAELLRAAGCDLLWLPTAEELFPPGFSTAIQVNGVSARWEGEARPGHFAGVATVVGKLLITVRPDLALFGEKDFQQLAVVRQLVRDLGLPVEIGGLPTVRDGDGLALSSRNAYLGDDERARAAALPNALKAAAGAIAGGTPVAAALAEARATLEAAGFGPIDYLALVDAETLMPLDEAAGTMRLLAAARLGTTRLIDNMEVIRAG